MKWFFDDDDDIRHDSGMETFVGNDGNIHYGMKTGHNMGIDVETGKPYMKFGDNFGVDL